MLSLIEKAQETYNEEQAKELEEKFRKNTFTLDDYLVQFEQLQKMGSINDLIQMIPGVGAKLKGAQIDEKQLAKNKAIIQSMTKKERTHPEEIRASHKQRIAKGSGTTVQDINMLLKQHEQAKDMMKQMKNKKGLFGRLMGM